MEIEHILKRDKSEKAEIMALKKLRSA